MGIRGLSPWEIRLTLVCNPMSVCDAGNGIADPVLEYDGDRKAAEEEAVRSREDKALTTRFLVYHGASYACNLITVAASVCYAMYIAEKCL